MKTTLYNPSTLEVNFASIIEDLQDNIQAQLPEGHQIVELENRSDMDNPELLYKVKDTDGDSHEIVVRIIQRIEG